MKYTIQDIKRWGYNKIAKYYIDELGVLNKILEYNIENNGIKSSAYSLLNDYNYSNKDYWGMNCIINDIEPFNELVDIKDYQKRRFRNTWDTIMKTFATGINLPDFKAQAVKEFGIRLALLDNEGKFTEVTNFYNAVIAWHKVITNNIELREDISLIDVIVTYDKKDFIEFILKEVKG